MVRKRGAGTNVPAASPKRTVQDFPSDMAPTALIPQHFPYLRKNDPPRGFHVLVLHHSSAELFQSWASHHFNNFLSLPHLILTTSSRPGWVWIRGWCWDGCTGLDTAACPLERCYSILSPGNYPSRLIPPSYILSPWHPGPFLGTPDPLADGLHLESGALCCLTLSAQFFQAGECLSDLRSRRCSPSWHQPCGTIGWSSPLLPLQQEHHAHSSPLLLLMG